MEIWSAEVGPLENYSYMQVVVMSFLYLHAKSEARNTV